MSDVERTSAGLQMVIPGCERRTLPKSTSRVDGVGQGLLHFYKPPSLREMLETRAVAFAAEQRTKGIAKDWVVRLLNCSHPELCRPAAIPDWHQSTNHWRAITRPGWVASGSNNPAGDFDYLAIFACRLRVPTVGRQATAPSPTAGGRNCLASS